MDEFVSDILGSSYLDISQKRFCSYPRNKIRLLAPAGSGKSNCILWRCLNIQQLNPKTPSKYIVFTFTKIACEELNNRLNKDRAFESLKGVVEITTLNAWGWKYIKLHTRGINLIDTTKAQYSYIYYSLRPVWQCYPKIEYLIKENGSDVIKVIYNSMEILKSLGFRHDIHNTFDIFLKHMDYLMRTRMGIRINELIKNLKSINIIDLINNDETLYKAFYDSFWTFWLQGCIYLNHKRQYTWEDQKYWPLIELDKLSSDSEIRHLPNYSSIFVDEFQDINMLDLNLLKTIAKISNTDITIIGDDDQAIYEWRGATPEFILNPDTFLSDEYFTITLGVNYRSPTNIIEYTQRLIKNNLNRVAKEVVANSNNEAIVEALYFANIGETSAWVMDYINGFLKKSDMTTIALIARKRSQIIPYQIKFALEGIQYYCDDDLQIFLSDTFNEFRNIMLIKSNLGKLNRNSAEVVEDFLKICDFVKKYRVKSNDKNEIGKYLNSKRPSNFEAALNIFKYYSGELKGNNRNGKMTLLFYDIIKEFVSANTVTATIEFINSCFQGLQKDYSKAIDDVFYVDPPFLYLSDYARTYGDDYCKFSNDLTQACEMLATVSREYKSETQLFRLPLHLMTPFRTKGKEYDEVIILDANEGIWPIKYAITPDTLEAERRLFYVATTRTRNKLSFLVNYKMLGENTSKSRFLDEMGIALTSPFMKVQNV